MKRFNINQNKITKLLTLLKKLFNLIEMLFSIDKSNVDFITWRYQLNQLVKSFSASH